MSIAIEGDRITGQAVLTQNVMAVQVVANAVRTSLGPIGLDKMLVDDVGEITITNDGATILKLMEVEHPAAKILCDLANIQDQEVGDGTTSVVVIAAELIKNAQELCKNGLHPTSVISGYRIACREACRFIQEKIAVNPSKLSQDYLVNVAKTSMSSKIISSDSGYFAKLVADAANLVKITDSQNTRCEIDKIKILKMHGGKMTDSMFIKGFTLNCTVACESVPKIVKNAKIALLDFGFQKAKMAIGIQVTVSDPKNLEAIRNEEVDIVMRRIKLVLQAGANVVLCTGGIDDLCLKPFVESKCMAVRRVTKEDLRVIAEMTNGTICITLSNIDGGESYPSSYLGFADLVEQKRLCDDELIVISGSKLKFGGSFILRGANDYLCEEMERSIHDALCAVKRVVECKTVVPGGGAVEAALSVHLENFATGITTNEQLAIAEYASSMLVIPKTLAVNAALDASDCVAALRSKHAKASNNHSSTDIFCGLDLEKGTVRNNIEAGVLEPTVSKIKMLKFATEAVITILRIDEMIKLAPEQKDPRPDDECC
ncbi:T-complex protein 1 subunit alpha [Thelohanellus kitauei]|uniref:T-complex protein 1 subunit alpha n=1 Tax=Thelohanellus kitauei TaxID=669202 RepID=A0A0C2M952_THEKT|nr:T-complex protein 1 subunit alpha [Thelohanellus kitauei]